MRQNFFYLHTSLGMKWDENDKLDDIQEDEA